MKQSEDALHEFVSLNEEEKPSCLSNLGGNAYSYRFTLFFINPLQAKGFVRHILHHGRGYSQTPQRRDTQTTSKMTVGETTQEGGLVYHHFSAF